MEKERVQEILGSLGIINVTYKNNPVWLESIGKDKDGIIQVRDLKTDKIMEANIEDLEE